MTQKPSITINKKTLVLLSSLFLILTGGLITYATPPVSPYTVGETLDPICNPGDPFCFVDIPTGLLTANNGLTASGTNVQLGGTLVKDTDIIQGTNTITSTFTGVTGTYTFLNGNYGPIQGTGMLYTPTATPHIVTAAVVGNTGAALATKNYITTESSDVSAWIDLGTGEHRAAISARASDVSSVYAFTSFAHGTAIMSEYNKVLDFTSKMIQIDSNNILQHLNYSRTDNQNYLYNEMKMDDTSLHFSIGNSVVAGVFSGSGKEYQLSNTGHEFKGLDLFANQYPNTRDDSGIFSPVNFLYTDSSGKILSAPTALLGGSGWSLTGNAGTDGGLTNFIGTTDAQDFVVKINTLETARFGQNGNVSLGLSSFATGGDSSFAQGSATASGKSAIAMGYDGTTASGGGAVAIGHSLISSGNFATAFGTDNFSRSYAEFTSGLFSTDYVPQSTSGYDALDRLFTIGNGNSIAHNAYTLWKDGSFAYNDDNFQNDNPGTEQNMFYFNYGNHDGLGVAQTKRAIRLGSALNDEWDINSANMGDRSVAIGFCNSGTPCTKSTVLASGENSVAIGTQSTASGFASVTLGVGALASGDQSFAINNGSASGTGSIAFSGGVSSGDDSFSIGNSFALAGNSIALVGGTTNGGDSVAIGVDTISNSFSEITIGKLNTTYIPVDLISFAAADRIFTVGNGDITTSDAFTILKDGRTAVAVDNFEANALPLATSVFQVGDGTTGIIGYVDSGTGNWVAVSDERKKHGIADISYGLSDILKLRPVSFNYNRNNEHTIGFLAQQVLPIIPESVYGTEQDGYGMSYQTLVPVTVKAIQELNIKLTTLPDTTTPNTFRDSLIAWLGDVGNGITELFAKTIRAKDQICIDDVCVNKEQLKTLLQSQNINTTTPTPVSDISDNQPTQTNTPPVEEVPPVVETPAIDTPVSDTPVVTE